MGIGRTEEGESIKVTVDWKWMLYLQHEVDFCLCHSPQLNMIFHAILASLGFLENIDQDEPNSWCLYYRKTNAVLVLPFLPTENVVVDE